MSDETLKHYTDILTGLGQITERLEAQKAALTTKDATIAQQAARIAELEEKLQECHRQKADLNESQLLIKCMDRLMGLTCPKCGTEIGTTLEL